MSCEWSVVSYAGDSIFPSLSSCEYYSQFLLLFTGIIESIGTVQSVLAEDSNRHFWVESILAPELRVDQSVAHDGVCLTVVEISADAYRVTAVEQTLCKTALTDWAAGHRVNLERSLRVGDRLDGHFVQGHVDAVGRCTGMREEGGSWRCTFSFPDNFAALIVEKGSVCINGVSLTAFNVGRSVFSVAIIPYTWAHTSFGTMRVGDAVNLEFDVLGKYLLRAESLKK